MTATTAGGRRVFSLTDEGRAAAEAVGDGPAPWDVAARRANRSMVDLGGLIFEVGAAIIQVGRAGAGSQVKAVADILTDTRRRIYLVLAEGKHHLGLGFRPGRGRTAGRRRGVTTPG